MATWETTKFKILKVTHSAPKPLTLARLKTATFPDKLQDEATRWSERENEKKKNEEEEERW